MSKKEAEETDRRTFLQLAVLGGGVIAGLEDAATGGDDALLPGGGRMVAADGFDPRFFRVAQGPLEDVEVDASEALLLIESGEDAGIYRIGGGA
jgi:hypothetical protein